MLLSDFRSNILNVVICCDANLQLKRTKISKQFYISIDSITNIKLKQFVTLEAIKV